MSSDAARYPDGPEQPPSEEHPFYQVISERPDGTGLSIVTVDEGWRKHVFCADIYPGHARWLVDCIQGQPLPRQDGAGW